VGTCKLLVYEALTYLCSVLGHKLLVQEALSYLCVRPLR
jgi:hypothetical protein